MPPSATLDSLVRAVDDLSTDVGQDRGGFLLDYGLGLHDTFERLTYLTTPINSRTFASTGGDGVHFGLLVNDPAAVDGPIVMTVPAASRANHVVAESLQEFLGLGCVNGWFSLEQLAYQRAHVLDLYSHADDPVEPVIVQLFKRLSLRPRAFTSLRLGELAALYAHTIVLPPEDP